MKLKKYIEENMIVQKRFAERVGISNVTLNSILEGKYPPSLKTAISIEKVTKGEISVYDWDEEKLKDQPKLKNTIAKKTSKSPLENKKKKTLNS